MPSLTILDQQRGWVAIDKPAGSLVIPGRTGEEDNLRQRLEAQLGEKLFVVHRLDRDTSGVLVFARDATTHRALCMAFEAGEVHKRYLALVRGRWETGQLIDVALVPARKGKMRPAAPGEKGKAARTRFRPLEALVDATLVEAEPLTGRTHQIRVHACYAGHPLLVDPQYGTAHPFSAGARVPLERTPLHAAALRLPALAGMTPVEVQAPLASDIADALEVLRGSDGL
jgi:tRNA pseudouridine32 synthase/23S rRNA pseudouridine746 synthase/23S rRNA pseudouridine955/2504/2580 synthase